MEGASRLSVGYKLLQAYECAAVLNNTQGRTLEVKALEDAVEYGGIGESGRGVVQSPY